MNILPSLEEVKQIATTGEYNVLPVSCEILSDRRTPIETLRVLKTVSSHCYLLESVVEREKWGRYTFLGYDPKLEVTCIRGEMKVGDLRFHTEDPSAQLRQILSQHKSPKFDYLPSFTGGLVGYFSYDYLTYSEPATRVDTEDTESFQDVDLMLFDKVIAFDQREAEDHPHREHVPGGPGDGLQQGRHGAAAAPAAASWRATPKQDEPGRLLGPVTPLFDKPTYRAMVERAKHYIREGDIFQIVLSNRLERPLLRDAAGYLPHPADHEPLPLHVLLFQDDIEVAGASPETLVKLEDGVLHTFPLAGTRPRGKTDAEDKALEEELLADEKELAEHNMLVDLGRNDLGKISKFGSVQVESLHTIERYSHVMHIGSTVRGEIRDGQGRAGRSGSGAPRRHPLRRPENSGLPAHRRAGGEQARHLRRRHRLSSTSPATSTPASPSASPTRKTDRSSSAVRRGHRGRLRAGQRIRRVHQQGQGCGERPGAGPGGRPNDHSHRQLRQLFL